MYKLINTIYSNIKLRLIYKLLCLKHIMLQVARRVRFMADLKNLLNIISFSY